MYSNLKEPEVLPKKICFKTFVFSNKNKKKTYSLSYVVSKFNHKGKKQEKIILITDSYVYNLTLPGIFSDIIAKMSSFGRI